VDRNLTQNLKLTAQYNGFFKFNGLTGNIDGLGRTPGDNNTFVAEHVHGVLMGKELRVKTCNRFSVSVLGDPSRCC